MNSTFSLVLEFFITSFTISFTTKYREDNLSHIFKIVLKAKTPVALMTSSKSLYKRRLKVKFLDMYCGKTYIECYNFCQ